jgi:glycosyltransferase involved in cell wall biosynthesis
MAESISIILPAKNEAVGLSKLLPKLKSNHPDAEIIVVDDGSTDQTAQICNEHSVRRVAHPYSMGNGAAVKSGARLASGDTLVFMDADGQHEPDDIARLLEPLQE